MQNLGYVSQISAPEYLEARLLATELLTARFGGLHFDMVRSVGWLDFRGEKQWREIAIGPNQGRRKKWALDKINSLLERSFIALLVPDDELSGHGVTLSAEEDHEDVGLDLLGDPEIDRAALISPPDFSRKYLCMPASV